MTVDLHKDFGQTMQWDTTKKLLSWLSFDKVYLDTQLHISKNKLILLSFGITATVLAYELNQIRISNSKSWPS